MPPGSDESPRSHAQDDAMAASAPHARKHLLHSLCHILFAPDLRWITALDIDACAGVTPPHNWAIMLPVSRRVQPDVYTIMAIRRYRDALLNLKLRSGPQVYLDITTNAFDILLLPPRAFRTDKPRPEDAYYAVALFLHSRHLYPEIVSGHRGRGSLLLTPRLDAQNLFTRMFADIGNGNPAHPRVLSQLQQTMPLPSQITAAHVAALKSDL